MVKYTVAGEEFTSRTALRKAWQQRVKSATGTVVKSGTVAASGNKRKRVTGKARRIMLEPSAARWFIEVAFLFGKQRSKLYPSGVNDIHTAQATNVVFLDRADLGFGSYSGKKNKHLRGSKCVFFQHATDKFKFRAVSSDLGDVDERKDGRALVIQWLRREIQCQIDNFREKQRALIKDGGYRCAICKTTLGSIESHVDHGVGQESFKELVNRFQEKELKRPLNTTDMRDNSIANHWKRFHRLHARLSMTCKQCNLTNK